MKTYPIFGCLCACALACGCTKQQEAGPERTGELHFGVSSLSTRGNAILGKDEITSIGVFGYTTGGSLIPNDGGTPVGGWKWPANLLDNQKVTKDTGVTPNVWRYTPQAFWPSDPALNNSFFAYSPHSSEFDVSSYVVASVPTEGGPPTLRYRLPETIEGQRDILFAKPVYNVNLNSADKVTDGMVKYQMEHALTWLAFVVAPASSLATGEDPALFNETYSVNRLRFTADNLPLTSSLDLETGAWNAPSYYGNVQWEFILDPERSHNLKPGATTRLTDESNRMMIFPFDIPRHTATIGLTFYYNKNGESYNAVSGEYSGTEYHYYLPIPQTSMEPGIVVVYLINISIEGASVEFLKTNRIEQWIDGSTFGSGEGDMVGMY